MTAAETAAEKTETIETEKPPIKHTIAGPITIEVDEDPSGDESKDKMVEEHVLPGEVLRKACALAVVQDLVVLIEDWDGSAESARRAHDAIRRPRGATTKPA